MFFQKKKSKTTNPFQNITDITDIQPGISPEIIDDIPVQELLDNKTTNSGLFGWFLGSNQPTLQETYSHSLYETVQTLSGRWFPLTTSMMSGHLTVDEFIQAGDYLCQKSSNWEWSFNPTYMCGNLPPNKQYLVNRGLIVEHSLDINERVYLDFQQNELWTCPQTEHKSFNRQHIYDISITYDETNRTPRMWVSGYSTIGEPLDMDEMTHDLNIEFIGTIATMIPHPITGILNISIHPCRHAEGISRLIAKNQTTYKVEQYLVYYLILMGCIFPTLNLT